jgi:SHS2 domain-containing protein
MSGGLDVTPRPAPSWEHFHHVADIGVCGRGPTLAEAFEQAALAMTAAIIDPAEVAKTDAIEIAVSATDREMLPVEWLDAPDLRDGDPQDAVPALSGRDP